MLSFLFDKYVGMEWPDHIVDVCLTLKEIAEVFYLKCMKTALFLHPCQHSLQSVILILAILISVQQYLVLSSQKKVYRTNTGVQQDFRIYDQYTKISFISFFFFFLFLAVPRGLRESQFPNQGSNSCPVQWKCGVLTTGLPGNSLYFCIILTSNWKLKFKNTTYNSIENMNYLGLNLTEDTQS